MIRKSLHILVGVCLLASGIAVASGEGVGVSGDEALKKLMDGNSRYLAGQNTATQRATADIRAALAKSQKPFAVVLSCSDSRVPPELIFDAGLGDIFVVRVAGNVPDPVVLGSIEYAVEHLGSPLVLVLGHERCGAVKATVDAKGKAEGNIGAIVKAVAPALKIAAKECPACKEDKECARTRKDDFVECVVDANIKRVAAGLTKQSKVLNHMVAEKKIRIVAGKYDLDDGKVTLFQ